jgi:hypothetical protein
VAGVTSKTECCEVCRFSEPVYIKEGRLACRRYPPAVSSALLEREIEVAEQGLAVHISTVYPVVSTGDWCGEFRAVAARKKGE